MVSAGSRRSRRRVTAVTAGTVRHGGPRRPRLGHGSNGVTAVTVPVTAVPPVTAVMWDVTVTMKGPVVAGCAGASDRPFRPIRRQG